MGLNSTDYGTQTITYDFQQPATTKEINKQIYKIVRPGIYDGFELSIEQTNPAQARVSNGTCYIEAANESIGVRIETADDVIKDDISSSTPYVIIHYEWYDDEDSYAEIKSVEAADILNTDIVIGKGVFSGSSLESIDSDDATHPREYVSNFADTIPLGESATVTSSPTGGTGTNLNGSTTDVVEAIQTAFNRLIDLSGVNDDGIKNRHIDFGINDTQINGGDIPTASTITTGGTVGDISSTTVITSTLQTLSSILKNMSGADDNSIKERHIDFGVSLNQIDADLLPLGTAIAQSISEATTNADFANSKTVQSAIADVLLKLSQVSNQVTTNKNNISSNDGDISSLQNQIDKNSNLPVGTIMMYDGSNWIDDVTMPGWYACISANSDKGCPDLVDNFIKGAPNGTKGSDYGKKGGSATITLSSNQLPPHNHDISHGHSNSVSTEGGEHSHKYQDIFHAESVKYAHKYGSASHVSTPSNAGSSGGTDNDNVGYQFKRTTEKTNINHNHTVSIDDHSGDSGNGGFNNNDISINPQHYKVIYIRKCYQR